MRKVPTTFELDEDDIKEAIEYWLNNEHGDNETDYSFDITFKVNTKQIPRGTGMDTDYRGPIGGMADPLVKTVITATAVKDE